MVNLVPLFSETPFLVNKVELAVQWNNLRGFYIQKNLLSSILINTFLTA